MNKWQLFWKKNIWKKPNEINFDTLNSIEHRIRYFKVKQKKDLLKLFSLILICGSIAFMMLTFLGGVGFDFSLRIGTIRIWHFLLAFFSGGALGVAGLLLQKMTKNNLADISILGIGSLNIIFVTVYILSQAQSISNDPNVVRQFLPLITIASSILGTSIIYFLAKLGGSSTDRFIIVGIALQFLFEAVSVAIINPADANSTGGVRNFIIAEIQNFVLGRFPEVLSLAQNPQWKIGTIISCLTIMIILGIAWLVRRQIDIIETNEKLAITYGIRVELLKTMIFFMVALLAGIEAAMIGTIALLGILAPNISKMLFGNKTGINLLGSFLIGGTLVMLAAFISVNLDFKIPIGFLSTAIIVPYFLFMIVRRKTS